MIYLHHLFLPCLLRWLHLYTYFILPWTSRWWCFSFINDGKLWTLQILDTHSRFLSTSFLHQATPLSVRASRAPQSLFLKLPLLCYSLIQSPSSHFCPPRDSGTSLEPKKNVASFLLRPLPTVTHVTTHTFISSKGQPFSQGGRPPMDIIQGENKTWSG